MGGGVVFQQECSNWAKHIIESILKEIFKYNPIYLGKLESKVIINKLPMNLLISLFPSSPKYN